MHGPLQNAWSNEFLELNFLNLAGSYHLPHQLHHQVVNGFPEYAWYYHSVENPTLKFSSTDQATPSQSFL
jgi:hypothetical protein